MSGFLATLELSGLNILLALSVYVTYMAGQFSLAQVGFWAIGAYVTGLLTAFYGVPLPPALMVSAILCAVMALIVGWPCLRIRGIYLALATLAFVEVVRVFLHNLVLQVEVNGVTLGPGGALGFRGIPVLTAWPEILAAVLATIAVVAWVERSRIGLSAQAIRHDETAAAAAGVNIVAIKVGMFMLGAAIAAAGGGLYATYLSFVSSDSFGFHLALISVFFVAVGGSNRFAGPVLGAVLLTFLPEVLRFAGQYRMVLYGVIVLALMLAFPRGLTVAIKTGVARITRRKDRAKQPLSQEG